MGRSLAVQGHKGITVFGRRRVHVHEVQTQRTSERILLQQKSRWRTGAESTWLYNNKFYNIAYTTRNLHSTDLSIPFTILLRFTREKETMFVDPIIAYI